MKKVLIVCSIAVCLCIFLAFIFWFIVSGAFVMLVPSPAKPKIADSEFPFILTYEIDGNTTTIEDVAIVEFDGYGEKTSAGQSRKWTVYTKGNSSSNSKEEKNNSLDIVILDVTANNEYDKFGNKILELYFYGGNGHYFMSDKLGWLDRDAQEIDCVNYMCETVNGELRYKSMDAEEAFEKFKIRLISWECAPPIENEFR